MRPISAIEPQDQVTFRGGVDLVTATVSVRDRKGRIIRDLKQADFEIIDSGAIREIKTFESGASSISLAVLVDISGSMSVGGNIGRARIGRQRCDGGAAVRRRRGGALHVRFQAGGNRRIHLGPRSPASREAGRDAVG